MNPNLSFASSHCSTTQPNTPEPAQVENENDASGDFARLVPTSRSARLAFHKLVTALDEDPDKFKWHKRYIYVRENLEKLDADGDDELSTGDEKPMPTDPVLIRTGFWRFNMAIRPAKVDLGWVIGRGRWNLDSWGSVDILLTSDPHEPSVRGRHARLLHNLESNSFIIIADKKLRFNGEPIAAANIQAFTRKQTAIGLGHLEYNFQFTNLDPKVYRPQLDELANTLQFTGQRPAEYNDPTPTETDYSLKNKYTIKGSFAKGSSCFVCSAIDNKGASFAVKKIIAVRSMDRSNAMAEANIMKRLYALAGNKYPSSIARFIEYISIEPSNAAGAAECFIVSQPLIPTTLRDVVASTSVPTSSRLVLLGQMLEGLSFLHESSCMHRDIKPENVLASTSPLRAVIIDFGTATWEETSDDHLKGTIRYLAPEVIALKDKTALPGATYTRLVDVWSMGLTLYELFSGCRIPNGKISESSHTAILQKLEAVDFNQDLSAPWAVDLIREMLTWYPGQRPTAQEALQHVPSSTNAVEAERLHPGKRRASELQSHSE